MLALISRHAPKDVRTMLSSIAEVIEIDGYGEIASPMSAHPDMLMLNLDECVITTRGVYSAISDIFGKIEKHKAVRIINAKHGNDYPADAILNALVIDKKVFIKADTAPKELISILIELGYEIIRTKQGYPACTVLGLRGGAAITADRGMHTLLSKHGIDVLLIENGSIALPPYEYGFIGGACGKTDTCVYFMGNAIKHPDFEKISEHIKKHGYTYCSLGEGELFDGGGIIFI